MREARNRLGSGRSHCRRWARFALVPALACLAIGVISAPATHAATSKPAIKAAPTALAIFNNPAAGPEWSISDTQNSLIDEASPGSLVQLAMYRLAQRSVVRALNPELLPIFLHDTVQVLLDGKNRTNNSLSSLNATSATIPQTWLKTCDGIGPTSPTVPVGSGNGCLGQRTQHNKILLVSKGQLFGGAPRDDMVFQSSANDLNNDSTRGFNNALLITGRPTVYNDYEGYFDKMAAAYRSTAPTSALRFNHKNGQTIDTTDLADHDIESWSFPRTARNDPVAAELHAVAAINHCANPTLSQPGPRRTHVDVAMAEIHGRSKTMHALEALSRAGCDVSIVYASISLADLRDLETAGVALQQLCVRTTARRLPDLYVHSKYFLVDGSNYVIGGNDRIVYTGSANWTTTALTSSDDRMVRYAESAGDSPVYDAYAKNFHMLQRVGRDNPEAGKRCDAAVD